LLKEEPIEAEEAAASWNNAGSSSDENVGKWSEQENAMFIAYLEHHRDEFRSKMKRR
jgi:hypothetical protein